MIFLFIYVILQAALDPGVYSASDLVPKAENKNISGEQSVDGALG
jgi:hypothetical protein